MIEDMNKNEQVAPRRARIREGPMKTMTYRELKARIEDFTDEQLDMEVVYSHEAGGGKVDSVWVVEDDQVNPSGDGMESVGAYRRMQEEQGEDWDPTEPVVCRKGQPILVIQVERPRPWTSRWRRAGGR